MGRFLLILGCMVGAMVVAFVAIAIIAALPWWGMMSGLFAIGLVAIWVLTFWDVWRRADLSPVVAIIWTAAVIIFPFLGTLVYFFTRPSASDIRYRGETVE